MLAAVLVADALVLGSIAVVTRSDAGTSSSPGPGSAPGTSKGSQAPTKLTAKPPLDTDWGMCWHGTKDVERVAITYLDSIIDVQVTEAELLRWFGKLPYDSVEVWKLEHKDGSRRVAFELDWTRWPGPPGWDETTRGWTGDDLCSALRHDLIARGVGRPRPPAVKAAVDDITRSRHNFEFFDERRADRYIDRDLAGTLADVVTHDRVPELLRWLEGGSRPKGDKP
jgi:hypothetical protein